MSFGRGAEYPAQLAPFRLSIIYKPEAEVQSAQVS